MQLGIFGEGEFLGRRLTAPAAADPAITDLTLNDVVPFTAPQNLLHAIKYSDLGGRRTLTLPALSITFGELVAALCRVFPGVTSRVTYSPDAQIMQVFGCFPMSQTRAVNSFGFRRDAGACALIAGAFS